jgi:hypothetical protein
MSKYTSFKSHQLITESWRKFLNEQISFPLEEAYIEDSGEAILQIADAFLNSVGWKPGAEVPPVDDAFLQNLGDAIAEKVARRAAALSEPDEEWTAAGVDPEGARKYFAGGGKDYLSPEDRE